MNLHFSKPEEFRYKFVRIVNPLGIERNSTFYFSIMLSKIQIPNAVFDIHLISQNCH